MSNRIRGQCDCQTMASLAADANCPLEFDETLEEYNLLSLNKKTRYRVYYCFMCGKKLPDSKRANLFTKPSKQEMKIVSDLLAEVSSAADAVKVLGEPDEVVSATKAMQNSNHTNSKQRYKRHYLFTSRWKTLDLTIREREDSTIDYAFTGKYKQPKSEAAKTKSKVTKKEHG